MGKECPPMSHCGTQVWEFSQYEPFRRLELQEILVVMRLLDAPLAITMPRLHSSAIPRDLQYPPM